jgi:hypothetical protein
VVAVVGAVKGVVEGEDIFIDIGHYTGVDSVQGFPVGAGFPYIFLYKGGMGPGYVLRQAIRVEPFQGKGFVVHDGDLARIIPGGVHGSHYLKLVAVLGYTQISRPGIHAKERQHAQGKPRFFLNLPPYGVLRGFAQLHQAAGQAPFAVGIHALLHEDLPFGVAYKHDATRH